jgi:hypothetical protein
MERVSSSAEGPTSFTLVIVQCWDTCTRRAAFFNVPTETATRLRSTRSQFDSKHAFHLHVYNELMMAEKGQLYLFDAHHELVCEGGIWALWIHSSVIDAWGARLADGKHN